MSSPGKDQDDSRRDRDGRDREVTRTTRSRSSSPKRSPKRSPRRSRSRSPPKRSARSPRRRSRSRDKDTRRRSRSRSRGRDSRRRSPSRSPVRSRSREARRSRSRSPRYRRGRSTSPPGGGGARYGLPPAGRTPPRVGTQLFVAGINFIVNEQDLERKFSRYGRVKEARVVRHSVSGESRGFAFVVMSCESEAEDAVRDMNGRDWNGRRLLVEIARNPR